MAVNVELLEKTLETIKANPKHWYQESWHCNSSHCFAGFTELLCLGLPIDSCSSDLRKDTRVFDPFGCAGYGWNTEGNARKELGLSENDGNKLFNISNTLEDLESMVKHLTEFGSLVAYVYGDSND